jgi:parvulin-like peptidyl-prolyl isomerase
MILQGGAAAGLFWRAQGLFWRAHENENRGASMSIVRMRKFFRQPVRLRWGRRAVSVGSPVQIIFWSIVIIFVVGAYYSFGPSAARRQAAVEAGTRVAPVVARVGGQAISRRDYLQRLERTGYEHAALAERSFYKKQVLDEMIEQVLLLKAARREGIKVSGKEVRDKQQQLVEEALQVRFPSKRELRKYLQRKNLTYEQLREKMREEQYGDLDALRQQLIIDKLRETIEGRVKLSDEELRQSFEEIKARHILIKPEEEQKRAQGTKTGRPGATAEELAKKKAEDLLARIKRGEDFATLAKKFSDDRGSSQQGGELGWFRRGQMVAEFEQAAFALQPGQVSGVVKSPFGYHIIMVEGRRLQLPKDFDKNKEQYRQQELAERKTRAWEEYRKRLRAETPVEILDNELRAYQLREEGKTEEALQALEQAVKEDPHNIDARYQLAMMYKQKQDKQRAADLLAQVVQDQEGARMADAHLALGDVLVELGRKEEALQEYRAAAEWAATYEFSSYLIHLQLQDKFKKLGQPALAEQEKKWLADYQKSQQEMLGLPLRVSK